MWWKRILIGLVILVVALYAAIYAFLYFYDLNRFKPRITSAVFEAVGRQLTIAGDLEVDFGLMPVLAAEHISLQNASWGSRPAMVQVERFQVRVALLPLILGKLEIASILLIGPDVVLEKNEAGIFNIPSVSGTTGSAPKGAPLIHAIVVENARVVFHDRQTGRHLELVLDQARAELPDADSPLEIDLDGTFNRVPVAVFGTIGRPLPAFMSGRQLPATLAVEIAGNRFQIVGAVENTADFSGLDWRITGTGRSIPDLVRLAGLDDLPDPGPFKFEVRFSGSPKHLTMSDLNLHLGERGLAKFFLRGQIGDLLHLQDVDLQVLAEGDDLKHVGNLFGTTIPWQGEFRATGRLVRSVDKEIRLENVGLRVGKSDVAATVALNLQPIKPRLSATIRSRLFDLRPLFAADAFQPIDTGEKALDRAPGAGNRVDRPRQLALLDRIDAEVTLSTGNILLPQMVINPLDTSVQLENGRIRIRTKGPRPPDLKELTGIPALTELGPIQLACDLVGTAKGLSLRNVDLQAGSLQQARVTVSGSIAEMLQPAGFDLDIRIAGDDAAVLEKYLLQPWPLRGRYTVSTRMVDPGKNLFTFESIVGRLEDIDFTGSVKVDAAGKDTRVAIAVNAPRFSLRPLVWPGLDIPETMRQLKDIGPLGASLDLIVPAGNIGIADLQMKVGNAELLAVSLQGAVRDVEALKGLNLELEAGGREMAELQRLFGKPIPLQGSYSLRTAIRDPSTGRYRFDPLYLSLADDLVTGFVDFDRSGEPMRVTADLSTSEIDLTEAFRVAAERASPDTGRIEKALQQQRVLPQWPIPPQLIQNLEADIRIRADRVKTADLNISGLSITGGARRNELKLKAEARTVLFRNQTGETIEDHQMGGVNLTVNGRALSDRVAIESFQLRGGSPETVFVLLQGSAADTIRQTGINLTFDIHGQDAGYVWQLLDADFRAAGPFSLSGSLTDPRPKQYRFEDLKAAVGESSVDGSLTIDYTGPRPRISARISTPYLDLRPYMPEAADLGEMEADSAPASGRSKKLFSGDPWSLEILEKFDLAVSLDAAQMYLRYLAAKDLDFELAVADGDLALKPLRFSIGGGKFSGEMVLHTSDDVPTLEALMEVSGYDVGRELNEVGRAQDIQGILNGRVELNGPAESTADFTGGLNGQVVFTVTEGKINNRIIGSLYSDISDTLLNLLTPGRLEDPFIDLNCLVQSLDIRNGQAQHLGLLDTPQTSLITTGTVDLARERLDVTLRSSSKGGVRVRGLGRIGLSLSRFTRPFKLSGTLANPTLAVDPSQTALTIGTLLGGLALGPAGIAAIMADVSVGDKNPCLAAMEALEKGEGARVEEGLGKGGDMIDRSADALVEGGKKVIEEGEKAIHTPP
jgi:uncharacterized protein involved in outer membrane biogenesis